MVDRVKQCRPVEVTSKFKCQGDWGADSLRLVLVNEDRVEDAVH